MKKSVKRTSAFTLAVFTLSFAACTVPKKIASAELSKEYARQITSAGEVSDDFKASLASLSAKLLKGTIEKGKNALVSPISAVLCLSLLNSGANGNTRTQFETLFGMKTDEWNRSLYAYTSSLDSEDDCKLELANSIWLKENALNVRPEFLQTNADYFGAQAYASPFDQTTVTDINNWCYNHTDGKIDKILETIPSSSVMYLINTLDFDAKWEEKYEKSDIGERTFHNYDRSTAEVEMLYSDESVYLSDENAIGFARPYKGERYSFVGVLPNENVDVYEYIDTLSGESWQTLWESRSHKRIRAGLPEFSYDCNLDLLPTLKALGVTDAFNTLADFSNIDETQKLFCSLIQQKTTIEVDRNGTKAAAITFGGMDKAAMPEEIYITFDRPFVYALVDNETGLPFFIGSVVDLP